MNFVNFKVEVTFGTYNNWLYFGGAPSKYWSILHSANDVCTHEQSWI